METNIGNMLERSIGIMAQKNQNKVITPLDNFHFLNNYILYLLFIGFYMYCES